jgi:hypothetical protein
VTTNAYGRTIETVKIASIRVRAVIVPVVLTVHLLFYVSVLVIAADQYISIIAVIRDNLIQVAMRSFQGDQLRVAARQA